MTNSPPRTHDLGLYFCNDSTTCEHVSPEGIPPSLSICQAKDCPHLLRKIRKSMIESYSFCPMQFYWVYIAGKQGGIHNDTWAPNQAMLVGTRFHEFASRFFDYYESVPESQEGWESLIPDEFNDAEREMAEWWVGYQLKRLHDLREHGRENEWSPISREAQMDNPIHGLTSTVDAVEWVDHDGDNWDVGRKTKQVCIVEYKTGRKLHFESAIRQCVFYALLWTANGNIGRVTHVKLVNPRLCAVETYKITKKDYESVVKSIVRLREIMKRGVYRPICSEGKFAACNMCDIENVKVFPLGSWRDTKFKQEENIHDGESTMCDVPGNRQEDETV